MQQQQHQAASTLISGGQTPTSARRALQAVGSAARDVASALRNSVRGGVLQRAAQPARVAPLVMARPLTQTTSAQETRPTVGRATGPTDDERRRNAEREAPSESEEGGAQAEGRAARRLELFPNGARPGTSSSGDAASGPADGSADDGVVSIASTHGAGEGDEEVERAPPAGAAGATTSAVPSRTAWAAS